MSIIVGITSPSEQKKISRKLRLRDYTSTASAQMYKMIGVDSIKSGGYINLLGSYLAACVIYRTLTVKSAKKLPRQLTKDGKVRGGLSKEQAKLLQKIANKMALK